MVDEHSGSQLSGALVIHSLSPVSRAYFLCFFSAKMGPALENYFSNAWGPTSA